MRSEGAELLAHQLPQRALVHLNSRTVVVEVEIRQGVCGPAIGLAHGLCYSRILLYHSGVFQLFDYELPNVNSISFDDNAFDINFR